MLRWTKLRKEGPGEVSPNSSSLEATTLNLACDTQAFDTIEQYDSLWL